MSGVARNASGQPPVYPDRSWLPDSTVPLSTFLDRVAELLRGGLPRLLWIEATVVDAKASTAGHVIELTDPVNGRAAATLRVFLASSALAAIQGDLGVPVDPALLVNMTTCLLIAPAFSRRWHLGGRVEAVSRDAITSLRSRLRDRTIAKLKAEGLWNSQRGLSRPRDITRIAVVHPAAAAGWADIAGELERWQAAGIVQVRSCPAPFEGEQAAAAIVAALRRAVEPIEGYRADLVLLVRGGGSRGSLAVLDDETVARAILACPVPVVCGTGHATDTGTLADMVAWRAVDTPSKALVLVAGIIGGAARTAVADYRSILTTTAVQVGAHEQQLQARQATLLGGMERAVIAGEQDLASLWSAIQVAAVRLREHAVRLEDGAGALLRSVLAAIPSAIEAEARKTDRVIGDGLNRAWRALARQDDGTALLSLVHRAATHLVELEEAACTRLRERADQQVERLLRDVEAELARYEAVLDGSDINLVLRRGFALVTDPAGHLVSTWAEAAASPRLTIRFADGSLTARLDGADQQPPSA